MTPEFIPERPKDAKYRTLIVLLDGTGDQDDKDATNIVLLAKMLYNGKEQLVHYREGIGADVAKDYTGLVRLAGMLNAIGLLRVSDIAFAKAAYDLYEEYDSLPANSTPDWLALLSKWENFRTEHKVKRPFVEFLGCWDSVNSVGMMDNIKLAYTATNGIVRTFRHAVALDERRAKFKQNIVQLISLNRSKHQF
ncbi:hypothetical protein MVEN_00695700 [Mycena venus]|uniref:T6SS Phospholipase effector Tle1-like catalytic domain-containing protein n=1 Tax=Mycena venus TaxID=2733690 RepID=A0A8H7D549_9AGAR|nr:hypothetical protein MVEN_00695700 [Mycena venus]